MKRVVSLLTFSAAVVASGGCTNLNFPQSTVYGAAAKQNFAAQVVDPAPAEGAPMMDAEMVDAAIERYRNDEVKTAEDSADAEIVNLQLSPGGSN